MGYGTPRTEWRTGYCGCNNNTTEIMPSMMHTRDEGYSRIENSMQVFPFLLLPSCLPTKKWASFMNLSVKLGVNVFTGLTKAIDKITRFS